MTTEASTAVLAGGEAVAFRLSFAQERLWFLDHLDPGSAAYNVPFALRLGGELDLAALEQALTLLIERHEILRTTFIETGEEPLQLVHPPTAESRLEILDMSGSEVSEAEMSRRVREEVNRPFDLTTGPLLRALAIRRAADDHVLVLTLHHIVVDAWSLRVLWRDLAALYAAVTAGVEPDLHEPAVQYGDFAVWQREWFSGERLATALDHWRNALQEVPAVLDLPLDRPRPAVQSDDGAHCRTVLAGDIVPRLEEFGREERATLFMTLLAAFAALLARYSGQERFAVGTPVANRNRVELEEVIGFFANTLALGMDLTKGPSFRELVRRTRETALLAYANQDLPFEKLVAELNPERSLSHAPLFQVFFQFHESVGDPAELPGLTSERVDIDRRRAKFDLSLTLLRESNGLRASFEYSTDVLEHSTVERLAASFEALLRGMLDYPDREIGDIDFMSDDERKLLVEWNATAMSVPDERVDQLISIRAFASPDAIAVEDGTCRLRYGELEDRSNRFARHLQELEVRRGDLVGLCLDRGAQMLIAALGVLKAGAGYVPLDPTYPRDRLAFMLEDSQAPVVVTELKLLDLLLDTRAQIVCVDRDGPSIAAHAAAPLRTDTGRDDVAVVIYTSGSTGKPKGVETRHGGLANLLTSVQRDLQIGADDVFLATTTLSFDIAATELYVALLAGGRVAVAPTGAAADPKVLAELVERHGATFLQGTPSGWRLLLDGGWSGRAGLTALTAGEPLTPELAEALLERVDALWNYYGPTETTVYSTGTKIESGTHITIGKPLGNTQIHILDRRRRTTPIGVPGELCIGGRGLARGYLGRPELTAERFVANPFGEGRLYRTGDLARWLPDGRVEFLGRLDHQIKIRGYRIELGEIESLLLRHDEVREAVVIVREDTPGKRRLVAYLVTTTPSGPDPAELRTLLGRTLPDFMIPAAYVRLPELPLGPSQKVDRAALPAPNRSDATTADVVDPRDDVEAALVAIWQDVLELGAPPGVHDDFFALGGHSLLAVRLMTLVDQSFGIRLPLATLFQSATIEGMATQIAEARSKDGDWGAIVPLRPSGSKPPLFFIHGHDGELLYFRDLVRSLGADQPAIGVQPPVADGRAQPFRSVEEMASQYADEILAFRPQGPHLLVGYCFSAVLAYEVALQLERQGHPPALVALIDALPRGRRPTRSALEREKLKAFLAADARGKLAWLARRGRGLRAKVVARVRHALYELVDRTGSRPPKALASMQDAIGRALSDYVTPASRLRLTLFHATGDQRLTGEWHAKWSAIAGEVEVHEIAAEGIRHDNIVREPYATLLAETLGLCAEKAVARERAADA